MVKGRGKGDRKGKGKVNRKERRSSKGKKRRSDWRPLVSSSTPSLFATPATEVKRRTMRALLPALPCRHTHSRLLFASLRLGVVRTTEKDKEKKGPKRRERKSGMTGR